MKCSTCTQDIIIHDNLLPNKNSRSLTIDDLTTRGMIYTQHGLIEYSDNGSCQICNDEQELSKSKLKSYRLRIIKGE